MRPILRAFSLLCVPAVAQAATPESLGLFDAVSRRFALFDSLADGSPDEALALEWNGARHILPISGDWDGNGVTDLGFYDPHRRVFGLLADRADGAVDIRVPANSWRPWLSPVVGDWDGDGRDDLALYDRFARRFSLLGPGGGRVVRTLQLSERRSCEMRPFAGDWDGDGRDELGLLDPRRRTIHLLRSKATGDREVVLPSNEPSSRLFPVAIDLDGDGRDELALFDAKARRFALLHDFADGETDGHFAPSVGKGERPRPVAGRWSVAQAQNQVPDTEHCRPAAETDLAAAAFETELLRLVNEQRASGAVCGQEGTFPPVAALAMTASLRCSARLHARDLARQGQASRIGSDGSLPEARIAAAGYAFVYVGEAVAGALTDPGAVVAAWMADGLTCATLLEPGFQHAGAGVAGTPNTQHDTWVLDLGAPQ